MPESIDKQLPYQAFEIIEGGVCAPQGFTASGVHCGIRKNRTKRDLALIYSAVRCSAASVYTLNRVQGAPIAVTKSNISDGMASAILCNSGNANTCNHDGEEVARQMCALVADELSINKSDVIIASTGVIGQPLDITPIAGGIPALVSALGDNSRDAAEAIMTTDIALKEYAVCFTIGGKKCKIGGIAKGSGMINPNMATMLAFLTTDAAISPAMLGKALSADVCDTFNMVSVDGDTSTNDMVSVLANGMAGNEQIACEGADYIVFCAALRQVTTYLCRAIARDGEGATKLLECRVTGAASEHDARTAAKAVISSSLVKCAMFGADANWGRVLCALGYSGAGSGAERASVAFSSKNGKVRVCVHGAGVAFDEAAAKQVLSADEIVIEIELLGGNAGAVAWGCDLTYDYVKINGDYRT